MTAPAVDFNVGIIEEFRANDGKVGGYFDGFPLLLLHNRGAKTGIDRINPLAYQAVNANTWAVFASKGGADDNPGWFYNVAANPELTIEYGRETVAVRAREAQGDEYSRIWNKQKADLPQFADYERKTARPFIPVIVLERR